MRKWFLLALASLFWQGTGLLAQQFSGQQLTRYQQLNELLGPTSFFDNHLSGFMLFDPDSMRLIFEKNSHMHFLPASTTKLLTFYASLVALKEAPAHLRYQELDAETLQIWGTGSPVWKYGTLPQPPIDALLKKYRVIYFSSANWKSTAFGYGWQWDDYVYAYSAERSPLPVYGNVVSFLNQNQRPRPRFNVFQDFMATTTEPIRNVRRDFHRNRFVYNPSLYNHPGPLLPFITSDSLTVRLLASITEREVRLNQAPLPAGHQVLRHGDLQRVWKDILQESDNFLAEQLLLMIGDALFGELDDEKAIAAITKTFLWDLPDPPKWVDGSGLSRHNLVTPRSMIALLQKIEEQMPRQQVLELLPKGGVNGTLKFNYNGPRPYVIGKTGTVSNHHSLVGYIRTNQDRYLMFAFMHNNYRVTASEVRREMEKVLRFIRDNY